jgi:hypothetical protein
MKIPQRIRLCLIAAFAMLAFALPSVAQNIRTVTLVKVKMDQEENWRAIVKDYIALAKKAGSKLTVTVWDSQTGASQHAIVVYATKWKELGEDDPALKGSETEEARLNARLNSVTESVEVWVDEMQPDMGIRSNDIPQFIRVGRTKVIAGRMGEVKAVFHDVLFPAIKKSGATDWGVAYAKYGTPTNEIHTYIGLKGWADLDGPVGAQKGMTADEYKAFEAKLQPLIESTEFSIWKFAPELSYIAPSN